MCSEAYLKIVFNNINKIQPKGKALYFNESISQLQSRNKFESLNILIDLPKESCFEKFEELNLN